MGGAGALERRHAALLRHTSDLIMVVTRAGVVLEVTPSIVSVLGWAAELVLGVNILEVAEPDDRRGIADLLERSARNEVHGVTELRVRHADGTLRWLEVSANNLLDDPDVGALVLTARDVTERHVTAELLVTENELLERIVGGAPLATVFESLCQLVESRIGGGIASVWLLEGPDRLVMQSAPSVDLSVIDRDLVLSASHIGLLGDEHPPVLEAVVGRSPEWQGFEDAAAAVGVACSWSRAIVPAGQDAIGSIVLFFAEVRHPSDEQVHVLELATHLAGLAVARDRSSRQMAHAATHDALTGLPNRVLFLDRLASVLRRAGGDAAVLFIDLDDFKAVNDTAGHAAGDQLLRQVAARLADVVRPDDLIARLGGDEFAVLCDRVGEVEAAGVARRVLEALDEPFSLDGRPFHVSASAGIAIGCPDATPDTVLRDADTAMYQAKRSGRSRYEVFTPEVREATVRRLSLEQGLRRAIETGEVVLHYQPIVCLRDGHLLGLEALARWTSPQHGVVPPFEFIDVAEASGLIGALGRQLLGQAVEQTAAWRRAGLIGDAVTVAVNVAAPQLADPSFVDMVVGVLADAGLPAANLCLEVTESAVMADVERARTALAGLQARGVTIAIDDFGTGHSSLARLRVLEAGVLKLDRTFILDLDHDPRAEEVVASVVQLTHALGKRLVVEGVELPSQLRVLRRLGADAAQGFHLARPQPPDLVEVLLRTSPRWSV